MTDKKASFTIETTPFCELFLEGFSYHTEAFTGPQCPYCQAPLSVKITIDNDCFTVVKTCYACKNQFVEDYTNSDSKTDQKYDD